MAADKIIRNSKLDTFLSKLATKLTAIFWRKAETTEVAVDSTPTANSNNLVKSGGVKSYVDNAIPSVPVQDVTVGGSSVVSSGTAVIPAIPDAVEANPTVPSGTTPTDLQNLKVGNNYYGIPTPTVPDDLDDLSDVNLGTPSDGDVLTYDSTTQKWVADAPSGGELSTDVVADKASNVKASTPKSVYDFVKPASQNSLPVGGLEAGILYNLSVLTGSVTIDLATPADSSVANEYAFTFTAGSTVPTISWPASIVGWGGNCIDSNGQPKFVAGNFYEVSIRNNIGAIMEVELS
jgi:hypothetical protein